MRVDFDRRHDASLRPIACSDDLSCNSPYEGFSIMSECKKSQSIHSIDFARHPQSLHANFDCPHACQLVTAAFSKLECRSNLGRITQWQSETDGLPVRAHQDFAAVEEVYLLFCHFNYAVTYVQW